MKSLVDNYTEEELKQIIELSNSYRELARKLGYTSFSGDLYNTLKEKVSNFDTSHFNKNATPIKRTVENVFIENSTADQSTLRRWYIKGEYTPYICSICGQKPIWQDKELTLILDHINGSNHDNRLENLRWVCPNCNQQLDTTNGKNKKIYSKKYYCKDCGKEISSKAERCKECSAKTKVIPLENMPITREELKNMIRTMPFTQIGNKYNVTDNAIRKWCEKFKLPKRKSDIKKYSDLDWSKI